MQVPRIEYKLRVFSFKIQFQTQVGSFYIYNIPIFQNLESSL